MLINKWRDAMIVFEADAGGSGAGEGTENEGAQSESPEAIKAELERTRAALKVANKEAADRRKKLDEIETAEKSRKEAELTEAQKAQAKADKALADLTALQQAYQTEKIEGALRQAATAAGFADPDDAIAQADRTGVILDDSNKVSGAAEAVAALATRKPYLLNRQAPNINSNSGGKPQPVTADQIAERKRATGEYSPL